MPSPAEIRGYRVPPVIRSRLAKLAASTAVVSVVLLALAPLAMAADGVGLAGRVSDKTITLICFGVMAFFTILVTVLALIQGRLDSRKERIREELERLRR
jgi:hypothetical protein